MKLTRNVALTINIANFVVAYMLPRTAVLMGWPVEIVEWVHEFQSCIGLVLTQMGFNRLPNGDILPPPGLPDA